MPDMLVRLYDLPSSSPLLEKLEEQGITIQRAMAPDKVRVLSWIGEHSSISAQGEADVCFARHPISLFLAVKERQIL
ncbi:MAG: GNAT family N-acetyltransferase, partial [Spirochaetales bacterium]|nr:GNAT family N-acetyltransferase [Spirochaetales bacterium]